jgi:hypothetical protein
MPLNLDALHRRKNTKLAKAQTSDTRTDWPEGSEDCGGNASKVEKERLSREIEQPILKPDTKKSKETLGRKLASIAVKYSSAYLIAMAGCDAWVEKYP